MKLAPYICILAGALPVISSALKPLVAYDVDYVGVAQRRHLDLKPFENLEERTSPINLGTYSLAKKFSKDFVLLQISLGKSTSVNTLGDKVGGSFSATITCLSCYITGDVIVTTTGVTNHESFFQEFTQAVTDPLEALANTLDLNLKFSLESFGGHFEFDIAFAGSGTYTIQLWKSESPVGIQLDSNVGVGLLFSLELTFTITAEVDFTTGFDIIFPPGTNFVLDPLTGEIVSMNIGGVKVNSIPFQFNKGSACITTVLRLKAQLKLEIEAWGEGFDIEAGLFWDPAVYKVCAVYQPSSPCEISLTEGFFEDAGAYARAVIDVGFANFSAGPTAVTTYYSATLPPQCLETSKSTPHSTTVRGTTKTSPPAKLTTTPIKETSFHEKQTTTSVTTSVPTKQSALPDTTHTSTKISLSSKHTLPTSSHESSPTTSAATGKSLPESPSEKSSTGSHSSTSKNSSSTGKSSEIGSPSVSSTGKHISSSHDSPATDMTFTGNKYHSKSENSSRAPYGNYSITKTTGTDTATLSTNTGISSTDTATLLTNMDTSSTGTATDSLSTDLSSSDTNGSTASPSPPPGTGSGTSGTGPVPTTTFMTTITIWATEIYTITTCISLLEWCPYSLTSEIVQTKTIIQYTTICSATQTDFPSSQPPAQSPAAAASTAVPTSTPIVVVANPVEMTPCETPIIRTVLLASPPPPITYTITGNGTTAYPVVHETTWYSPTYVRSSTYTTPSGMSISTSMSTTASTSGVAIAIYSIGGFATPPPTSTTPEAKAQGTATTSATPSYVHASGARSPFTSSLVVGMAVAFLMFVML